MLVIESSGSDVRSAGSVPLGIIIQPTFTLARVVRGD